MPLSIQEPALIEWRISKRPSTKDFVCIALWVKFACIDARLSIRTLRPDYVHSTENNQFSRFDLMAIRIGLLACCGDNDLFQTFGLSVHVLGGEQLTLSACKHIVYIALVHIHRSPLYLPGRGR